MVLGASFACAWAAPSALADGFSAIFQRTSTWQNNYVGYFTLYNGTGGRQLGWKLTFQLPPTETVQSAWNGVLLQAGDTYVLSSEPWNDLVWKYYTVHVGIQGTFSGQWQAPTGCTLNGVPCDSTLVARDVRHRHHRRRT